jgi:dTDP-4-amino-4,6-dideoxygalactose transaminase
LRYPLASSTWNEEEKIILHEVIESGNFTMGSQVKSFELDFANHFNSKYSLMVNSGSSANLLMLQALRYSGYLKPDQDEIIVPAVSWSTTYFPINQSGFKIIFVDINIDTFNIRIENIAKLISKRTAAILAVNLLGEPSELVELKKLCDQFGIILLEDNCESMGSSIESKMSGTFGLMGSFSTFYSHHICTMEGGVITTDDDKIYDILLSLRAHGWLRELKPKNSLYDKSDNGWQNSFTFILPGYNLRPLELEGAVGKIQLRKLPNFVQTRRDNAEYLIESLKDRNLPLHLQYSKFNSSWFGFGFLVKGNFEIDRDKLVQFLSYKGIDSRPIVAGNFTRNPVIKYLDYVIQEPLHNADYLNDHGFFIGNHHYPIQDEILYFLDSLTHFMEIEL